METFIEDEQSVLFFHLILFCLFFFFFLEYIMLKVVDLDSIKTWGKTLSSEFLGFLRLNVNSEEYKKHTFRFIHP